MCLVLDSCVCGTLILSCVFFCHIKLPLIGIASCMAAGAGLLYIMYIGSCLKYRATSLVWSNSVCALAYELWHVIIHRALKNRGQDLVSKPQNKGDLKGCK